MPHRAGATPGEGSTGEGKAVGRERSAERLSDSLAYRPTALTLVSMFDVTSTVRATP